MFVVLDHMSPKWVETALQIVYMTAAVDIVIHLGLHQRSYFATGPVFAISFLSNFEVWKMLVSVN